MYHVYNNLLYDNMPADLSQRYGLLPITTLGHSALGVSAESPEIDEQRVRDRLGRIEPGQRVCFDYEPPGRELWNYWPHWPAPKYDLTGRIQRERLLRIAEEFPIEAGCFCDYPPPFLKFLLQTRTPFADKIGPLLEYRTALEALADYAALPAAFYLSAYHEPGYETPDRWQAWVVAQAIDARRYAPPGKPILVYWMPVQKGSESTHWTAAETREQLELLRRLYDGLVLFGGWRQRWDAQRPWWKTFCEWRGCK